MSDRIDVQLVRDGRAWYDDRENLADLVAYLMQAAPYTDWAYLLRKPWKWSSDYEAMRREEAEADAEAEALEGADGRYAL